MSVTETRTVASIIGGQAREGGTRVESRNPANLDELVCEAWLADADGVRRRLPRRARGAARLGRHAARRCAARRSGASAGSWRTTRRRSSRLLTREIGKPYPESLGEVQEVIDTCDFFVSEGRRLYGQTVPSELPDKQLFTFRNPVGVAAIITAGNFPVAVPSWYLVPALLCGNAVVWKPAEYAPALGQALTELFLAGGLPDGVLNLVQCDGPSAFEGLERALVGAAGRQGRLHRLVRRSARASASCAGATSSRPASSWAARTRWS